MNRLYALQSNAESLAAIERLSAEERLALYSTSIPEMKQYVSRLGLSEEATAGLRAVHIAGTKGKGSTSAMVESIFRASGLRTGLFTSPHLVSPRERIKLNGIPISEEAFAESFFRVWHALERGAASEAAGSEWRGLSPHPMYFRYLTLMSLDVFVRERVDVAVVEVGIGGRFDATNVLAGARVAGISSLGYDHVKLLGTDLSSIAWHKAGIIKPGCVAVSTDQDAAGVARTVIEAQAREAGVPLLFAPAVPVPREDVALEGDHQIGNAQLAVALARAWFLVEAGTQPTAETLARSAAAPLGAAERTGLRTTQWPARSQRLPLFREHPDVATLYVDGAHTFESISVCAKWFAEASARASGRTGGDGPASDDVLVLLSACKPTRDPAWLMLPLQRLQLQHGFALALFCSTDVREPDSEIGSSTGDAIAAAANDAAVRRASAHDARTREWLERHQAAWLRICMGLSASDLPSMQGHDDTAEQIPLVVRTAVTEGQFVVSEPRVTPSVTLGSIESALRLLKTLANPDSGIWRGRRVHVLVTGSLYLAGGVLELQGEPVR